MDFQQIITLIIIGLVGGFLSGALGIGGAIVIIPALVLFMGFSQQTAQGTTLFMMVLPVGALAAVQYYKAGNIEFKPAWILASAFLVSGFLGAKVATQIPQDALKKAFAILLVLIAVKMLFFDKALK